MQQFRTPPPPGPGVINPQFTRLVTPFQSGGSEIYDLTIEPRTPKPLQAADVACVRFSPDGKRLATGGYDGVVRLWDAETGAPLSEPIQHRYSVGDVAFNANGSRLLAFSENCFSTGTVISKGSKEDLSDATFQVNQERALHLYDTATGKLIGKPMPHYPRTARVFTLDGKRFATCNRDPIQIWDAATGEPIGEPITGMQYVDFLTFSPDGTKLLLQANATTVQLWDVATRKLLWKQVSYDGRFHQIRFSPDGTKVAATCDDKAARIWDVATGKLIHKPFPHKGTVYFAAFTPDNAKLITVTTAKVLRIWSVATGKMLSIATSDIKGNEEAYPSDIVFFHEARNFMLLPVTRNNFEYWEVETGQPKGPPLKLP